MLTLLYWVCIAYYFSAFILLAAEEASSMYSSFDRF